MSKKQKALFIGIIMTELSHIFCCVLPLVFSVLALLAGLGLVIVLPDWLNGLHDVMHGFEVPVIIAAGVMVALGWAVHLYSYKNDCHDHGCSHKPCTPRKKTASKLLKIGTILFLINIVVFLFFHDGIKRIIHGDDAAQYDTHEGHDHGHDHDDDNDASNVAENIPQKTPQNTTEEGIAADPAATGAIEVKPEASSEISSERAGDNVRDNAPSNASDKSQNKPAEEIFNEFLDDAHRPQTPDGEI